MKRLIITSAFFSLTTFCAGCDDTRPTTTAIGSNPKIEIVTDFTAGWAYRFTTIDVAVEYVGKEPLSDVNVTVFANFEEGASPSYPKVWAYWNPTETKTINMPRSGGKLDRIKIEGKAIKSGKQVDIVASFNFTKK